MADSSGDFRSAVRIYRRVIQQDTAFISEIIDPIRRCCEALSDTAGYAEFLLDVMPLYDGAQPHVAYAWLLSRQNRTDEGIAHLSRYLQDEPSWIGFYHMLDLAASAQQSGLTGPLDSLRLSLDEIIQKEALYHCGHWLLGALSALAVPKLPSVEYDDAGTRRASRRPARRQRLSAQPRRLMPI